MQRKVCTQVCPVEADTFSTEAAIRELLGELLGLEFGDAVAQVHTMCSWEAEEG